MQIIRIVEKAIAAAAAAEALLGEATDGAFAGEWVPIDAEAGAQAYRLLEAVSDEACAAAALSPPSTQAEIEFLDRLKNAIGYTLPTLGSDIEGKANPTVHSSRARSACRMLRDVIARAQSLKADSQQVTA